MEEEEEMKKIQEEIFENFQDRIQLRRALMEVEEQNAMNILEIKKRQTDVLVWKRNESSIPGIVGGGSSVVGDNININNSIVSNKNNNNVPGQIVVDETNPSLAQLNNNGNNEEQKLLL